jgi:mono/diheme cytochrome c family protein
VSPFATVYHRGTPAALQWQAVKRSCLWFAAMLVVRATTAAPVDFDREIRPILSDNCFACHGPDEKQRMAKLRLDTKDGVFADRGGYQVLTPGKAADSKLYQRISASDKAQRMPPPYADRTLNDKQIELIRRWIDEGAKWETHWAYVPPKRPDLPEVKAKAWPRNPIDNFILARLESEGLKPSPEADRATLIRRVTFDLTGLPPTPAEVDAFLRDKSHDAYAKVVDRLLASPRYGERMTMHWMDLARYADTHGYHIDSHREMWHWRDWTIDAFNRNMPFDEFTIEQLAGDLLPHPTLAQRIATGFNRNHMINFEGGAIPEEYQNEYVVDRVETTSVVWLGMTMGCSRCHDHKYDPIKQKDFYRFYAFFNSISEKGLDGRKGNAQPVVQVPSPEQGREVVKVEQAICEHEAALPENAALDEMQAAWEKMALASLPEAPRNGLVAHYELDGNLLDSSGHYRHGRIVKGDLGYDASRVGRAADFDGETQVDFGDTGGFERSQPVSIAFWMDPGERTEMAVLQKLDGEHRGWELFNQESEVLPRLRRGSRLEFRLIHHWPDDAIRVRTRDLIVTDAHAVTVTYDGSGKAAGVKMYMDGKAQDLEVIADTLNGSIANASSLSIGDEKLGPPYRGSLDDLRIYSRLISPADAEELTMHQPARATVAILAKKRSTSQKEELRDYYLTFAAPEDIRKIYGELKNLNREKEDLDWTVPDAMVMQEMDVARETAILGRGDYRNRGEVVTPGVPAVLPAMAKDLPADRLGLAKWLVDPGHPLTARVAVNRYWQVHFGTGIVKTAEDFGSQGDPPSHPALLDWLATEFTRTNWDVKAMQKLMVTSAAYRQSSHVTPDLRERDPENRLIARGPRFRLPAEMVRDNALAVSGLLVEKLGGPAVFPYQPKGLWEEIAFGDVYSAQTYSPGHGQDLYRRSMYTFWKRTSPPPSLITFDAPDREKCTARRAVTNTPLQALVLLNDPTYVEAARALAERIMNEGGADAAHRIRYAFRLATAREPDAKEVQVLREIERTELAQYRRNKDAAAKLIGAGESKADPKLDASELAAWTTVASTILNLDETITRE